MFFVEINYMEFKIKNRHRLRSKEIRKILFELEAIFGDSFFDDKLVFERGVFSSWDVILINNEPLLFYKNGRIFFTLYGLNKYNIDRFFAVVDMGAVRFIANGADVMAPGVVDADTRIKKDDIVWVCDEKHRKPLAIGFALMSGEQMINEKKGKAISVFHHVGDDLWNFAAKSL